MDDKVGEVDEKHECGARVRRPTCRMSSRVGPQSYSGAASPAFEATTRWGVGRFRWSAGLW